MRIFLIVFVFVLPLVFGCDAAKPVPRQPKTPPIPAIAEAPQPEIVPAVEEKAPEPETVRVKAEAGVTGKGQYDHGGGERPMDILLVPLQQYFRVQERITFDIQLKHTEDLYKAAHDNKLPATHEEYMKEIIEAGQVKLPQLPAGHKYVYDPEEQQLMVEKPK